MTRIVLCLIILFLSGPTFAVQPNEMLTDPQLEARARVISEDLRCLVCQNQSIDDSDADLAHDLRVLVRQRLQVGDSNAQVKQYLVDRYGDYILLNPPLKAATILLWVGPLLMFILGIGLVGMIYRRRKTSVTDISPALSEHEKQRLAELMPSSVKQQTDGKVAR